MFPLPLAATQPSSPTYNATPATRGLQSNGGFTWFICFCNTWCDTGPCQCGRTEGAENLSLSQRLWPKALVLLPAPCLQMALATGGAKIQSLYWEAVLSTGLAFMLPIYFFYLKYNKRLPRKNGLIFWKDKVSSKSGITDSKTFRKIWKLFFFFPRVQQLSVLSFFLFGFLFFLQDYCRFIFA